MQETIADQEGKLASMKNVLIENHGLVQKAMQDIVALQSGQVKDRKKLGLKLRMSNHDDKVETLMEIIKVTKRHVSKLLDESGDIAGLKKDVLDLSELTNVNEANINKRGSRTSANIE